MRVKLHFHKSLRKYTNGLAEHEIEAANMSNVISGLVNLFPKLNYYLTELRYSTAQQDICILNSNKKPINQQDLIVDRLNKKIHFILYIVPIIFGSGKGFGKFIMALVIIVIIVFIAYIAIAAIAAELAAAAAAAEGLAAAYPVAAGASSSFFAGIFTPKFFFGTVIRLVISIAIQAMNKPKQREVPKDGGARRNNDAFAGLVNTSSPGAAIPLCYGMQRSAGHLLSGFIETKNHPKDEDPRVSENFS
jgi:predicted phage tail protein